MKILITGGAGFIGSTTIKQILKKTDHKILNIDNLSYASNIGSLDEVSNTNNSYKFKKVSINNKQNLKKLFREFRPNVVLHLAAETHVDRSIDSASNFIETNILGTFNLLEIAREYFDELEDNEKRLFLFHHVSTDEVYGSLAIDEKAFTENSRYKPNSPYSASKSSSDHLVMAWHKTYNLPTVITNCSNNYGPCQFPEKLIPLVITKALKEQKIPIYGDGLQVRDGLYVEDHANALINVFENGIIGEIYNIGGDCEKSNIEVVKIICDILDNLKPRSNDKNKKYFDLVEYVADRPGHDKRYAINSSKIKKNLGWQQKENFETGINKTIKWYLSNLDWCDSIAKNSYKGGRLGLGKINE